MADSIEQTFGLDASAALAAMQGLDSAFQNFGTTLTGLGPTFTTFNTQGTATVTTLRNIASAAREAAAEMAKLGAIKPAAIKEAFVHFGILT